MKIPREVLLEHHRSASTNLDTIRRDVLRTIKEQAHPNSWSLRDCFWSLRWHLAGLSIVWTVILFLNMGSVREPQRIATVPPVERASAQVILACLRENRREIAAMIGNTTPDADKQKKFLSKPRSELRDQAVIV